MKWCLFLSLFVLSFQSQAGFLLEAGGTYLSDQLNTSSSEKSTKYFYNVGLLFSMKKRLWGGWNYSGISHTDQSTEGSVDYSSTDTGPYFKWQFGRNELYSLSFAYNLLSKATYSDGTTAEEWTGTSMWFQFGVAPELKEGLHIGASLNYFLANYNKKTVGGTESGTSNSKSWIFPMLVITREW